MAASAINLAQNDSRRVFEGLQYFHFAWSAVFEVAAVILFLLLEVGVSGLAAVAVIALLIPTQAVFVRAIGRRQRAAMTKTVRRSRTPAAHVLQRCVDTLHMCYSTDDTLLHM